MRRHILEALFVKTLIVLLLLSSASFGQSPFDGTWVTIAPLRQKAALYLLFKGTFRCSGCMADMEVNADGDDHKVGETAYWDTLNVQMVDAHTVEIIAKKAGKTMLTEVDAISPDGSTMTQLVKDTTEAETVTIETRSRRIEKGPDGSHAVSGSWRAYETNRSRNGSIIKYKCTEDGFSAETPLGERFTAKFDGKDYPVEDDPGHTMVSAKVLSPDTIELTSKRNGEVVAIKRMSVVPGGRSIHVLFKNKEGDTIMVFDMRKEP
ncbi:MAG: hypothetical protein JWO91_2126 [Acidobacteriaceae bacterium]|jgi:hypothetical protein|nr:hypothetical protein [Acidobacteriaceae bacterium]